MKKAIKLVIVCIVGIFAFACGGGGGGGGGDDASWEYVYEHNAKYYSGYTWRWSVSTVRVAANGVDPGVVSSAFNRWSSSSGLGFSVGSGTSGNIVVSYGSLPAGVCGMCQPYVSNGRIVRGVMTLRRNPEANCGYDLRRLITHEAAHCLGFLGHDSSGIMTPNVNSDEITGQNHGFFAKLYSKPPLTYVPALYKEKQYSKKPAPPKGTRVFTEY